MVSVRRPSVIDEAGRDFGCDCGVGDRRAGKLGFGKGREPRRADQRAHRSRDANSRISARVYSRPTVACVPSTETRFDADCAQAGLIAGTVPTKGTEKRAAQFGQRKRGGGVAGDDDQIWFVSAMLRRARR